jgi:hypothetical protein
MGFFYFDESIHQRGKFALGSFVYSETSLDSPVAKALLESGLVPGVNEFKSGARMDRDPRQARSRELLREVIYEQCGIGVVVAPDAPRELLGFEASLGLTKILSTIKFRSKTHDVFFDKGISGMRLRASSRQLKSPLLARPAIFTSSKILFRFWDCKLPTWLPTLAP